MDEYGQIGPDKPDYESDLGTIRRWLADGPVAVTFAARMTQYALMLVAEEDIAFFDARPAGRSSGRLLVVWIGRGSAWLDGEATPAYIADRLHGTLGDGEVIAGFLEQLRCVEA